MSAVSRGRAAYRKIPPHQSSGQQCGCSSKAHLIRLVDWMLLAIVINPGERVNDKGLW